MSTFALSCCCAATTIISVDDPGAPDYATSATIMGAVLNRANTFGFSFTTNAAFAGVTIEQLMFGAAAGTVYLTTRAGPGTTVADEVDSEPYSVSLGTSMTFVPVVSVSLLPAGTYYVTFVNDGTQVFGPGFGATSAPVITTAGGVSGSSFVGFPLAGYPPASPLEPFPTSSLVYRVTAGESVPEPSSWVIVVLGLSLIIPAKRLRR
jgi:hypothetical protein